MEEKRNRIPGLTLAICLVLLGLNLWQNARITELQDQLSSAQNRIMDRVDALHGRMTALETQAAEGEKLVRDWELAPAGMDRKTHSLLTEVSLDLKEWRADTEVWLTAHQGSGTRIVTLESTGTGKFSGPLPVSLEGEAISLEVLVESDGTSRREELGGWGDAAMLLPVQMSGSGYSGPEWKSGVFSLGEYVLNLSGPDYAPVSVTEPVFSLRCNGETVWEGPGVSPEEAAGVPAEEIAQMVPQEGAWSTGGPVEIQCQPGDSVAMFFTCRDEYGLKYTFPLERWQVESGGRMPVTAPGSTPDLSWD